MGHRLFGLSRGIFGFAAFTLIATAAVMAAGSARAETASFVSCNGKATERSVTIDGRVVLNQKFNGDAAFDDAQIRSAIEYQLKYVRAAYFYRGDSKDPAFLPSAAAPEITLRRKDEVPYSLALKISEVRHPDVKIESIYLKSALRRGMTAKEDPATQIFYTAKISGVLCTESAAPLAKIDLLLPVDPYLAYWNVTAEKFRTITWKYSTFKTNPCADAEIADLPHPEYYWYFWRPERSGTDAGGKTFECGSMLTAGREYLKIPSTLAPPPAKASAGHPLRISEVPAGRPIRGSVIFGVIDPKLKVLSTKSGAKNYAELRQLARKFLEIPLAKTDRGSKYFARFVRRLPEVLTLESIQVKPSDEAFRVSGNLLGSGRAVEFLLFFGPTDLLAGETPRHWNALGEAVAYDDFIVYNGHSGLGENYAMPNLIASITDPKIAKAVRDEKPPAYQLVAYLSCYTYSYFKTDLIDHQRGKNAKTKIDVVTTASEYTSEKGPLGILDLIDRQFSRKLASAGENLGTEYFEGRDSLVVKNF